MTLKFEWDKGNHRHFYVDNAEREIVIEECESIFYDSRKKIQFSKVDNFGEKRYLCLGMSSKNRLLAVAFCIREGLIRPISSYPVSKPKLRRIYEED